MMKPVFSGVCTALVTPFQDGKIDFSLLEKLIKRQIDAGVRAIVLSGTTGESATLSDQEKYALIQHAKAYVGDSCTIIAGTGTNCTEHAKQLSEDAQIAGADALLMVSPYYNKANSEGLFSHYMTIAHNVSIPIILYNVPSRTGLDIPVSVYQKLSKIPNIVGVKEAASDITKIAKIRRVCGDSFHIWSGNDDQIVPVVSLGGKGVISVISNLLPAETVALTDAALSGNFKKASALQCQLMPLIELLFRDVNPIPVKYAMKRLGFDCGDCRLPLGRINEDTQRLIDQYFQ